MTLSKKLLLLMGLFLLVAGAKADLPFRNHRYDAFRPLAANPSSVLFVGNSITNMHEWWEAFGGQHEIRNRGVSGAVTQEFIDNLDEQVAGQPQALFLMMGTNDLGTNGINNTAHVVKQMRTILTKIAAASPATRVYVQSILPSAVGLRTVELLSATNQAVRNLLTTEFPTVQYVDLWNELLPVANSANPAYTSDGLHLKAEAYRLWCEKALPLVQQHLPEARVVYPANTASVQQNAGMNNSIGMRLTSFSQYPVHKEDVLLIGDELIHGGEWHEYLNSPHVKNRGTGWGLGSLTIAQAQACLPAILTGRANAADNEAPAQIYLYVGYTDIVSQGTATATAIEAYRNLVQAVRTHAPASTTKVCIMGVVPHRDAGMNRRILSFNAALQTLAASLENTQYINTHTPLMEGTQANPTYIDANNYLTGKGYVRLSALLAETMREALEVSPVSLPGDAQPLGHLLPQPKRYTLGEGHFQGGDTLVEMVTAIPGAYDYPLHGYENEAYQLDVATNRITIRAVTATGVIRARQTLAQLTEEFGQVPVVSITDWPAFKLRGLMHDVGRSFISIDELKKEIDLLARFKMNTFHWHLTDNQGFRFESKRHPQLNQESSFSRYAGQFYTQEECKALEAYARERGLIIIPEIDMPGHSQAFTRAMGFTMESQQGRAVLKELLEELCETFPHAPFIHMGADEAGTTAAFVNEMAAHIQGLGRKVVVWNPISGVNISTTTLPTIGMTSMWSTSGRKIAGLPNIDSRYNYINHFDVFADLVGIYKSQVYYADRGNSEIAGAITAIWNDRKVPTQEAIIRQNNMWANALATVERCWKGGGRQYIETGGVTLPNSGEEHDEFADFEQRLLWHKARSLNAENILYVKQTNVRWRITDAFPNGGNASAQFAPEQGLAKSYTHNGQTYGTRLATGAGIYLRHVWGTTVPAFYAQPALNTTAYAWTHVYSPAEQEVGALIEFQNYSRSENDHAPEAGQWDRKGSLIWLNDQPIAPPTWGNTGKSINAETDLLNENFTAREPHRLTLKQGWNKVFLKLPYVNASNVRLNKWMFTFVLTDLEGKNALDNVVYSPDMRLDEQADLVAAKLDEMRQHIHSLCGESIGAYPLTAANGVLSVMDQVAATLDETLSLTQREEQLTRLDEALQQFLIALSTADVNQPKAETYYHLTDKRLNYYATSLGQGQGLKGNSAASARSIWRFVARTDGNYDIQNYADKTYISPAAANNSSLKTQNEQPATGWRILPSAQTSYVIIVSGTAQFNQTQSGLGFAIYNWGNGTNTTDTGCQYSIREVTDLPQLDENGNEQDPYDGRLLIFTNIQQNGTQRTLWIDPATQKLEASTQTPEELGAKARFRCTLNNGHYRLFNEASQRYMVWRGKGGGYNGDTGTTATYTSPHCDWQFVDASATQAGTFYLLSKRANGSDGSLVILRGGAWDAYANAVGWHANFSNLFRISLYDEGTGLAPVQAPQAASGTLYTLSGQRVARPVKGIYVKGNKKVVLP